MKITYSHFTSDIKRLMHDNNLPFVKNEVARQLAYNILQHPTMNKDLNVHISKMTHAYYFSKDCEHYFISSHELCEFLENSVKQPSVKELDNIVSDINKSALFCFHFPASYMPYSALLNLFTLGGQRQLISLQYSKELGDGYVLLSDRTNDWTVNYDTISDLNNRRLIKLIFGLCYYIKCFPESITTGFPDNGKNPSHYKFHNLTVNPVSEIIKNESTGRHAPHFRNGHFRYLQSERFKNKRYQVVFVSECFIGSEKVKTVEDVFIKN